MKSLRGAFRSRPAQRFIHSSFNNRLYIHSSCTRRLSCYSSLATDKKGAPRRCEYQYNWIEDVESLEKYVPGGYHPVMIGDVIKRRYEIVGKLGYGGFSTVWLARDMKQHTYVAVKIGASDSRMHETTVMKALSDSKPSVLTTSVTPSGAGAIPTLLDEFTVDGPNGTHPCYTTAVAECNVRDCSSLKMFNLDVARALSLKLVSAVAYMHGQGYVHGDIHLGNSMIQLNSGLNILSIDQLYEKYGRPQTEDISRVDDGALPPSAPAKAVRPLDLGKPASEISLKETNLLLVDFGESFAPAKTFRPCEDCRSYLAARPPEYRFEPLSPLSFSADIWCLGIALWDLVAMKPLFNDQFVPPDSVVAQQEDILGPMPPQWWEQWEKRFEYFDGEGNSTRGDGDTSPPLPEAFDAWGQKYRAKRKAGVLPEDEAAAFISLLSRMLSLDPRGRPSANEVLASEWMKNWAMPSFEQSLTETPGQNAMP
ncbi:hypothetical protein MY3296_009470 [Beauveria thailandica]